MEDSKQGGAHTNPAVIVGAACRVPGATNLHELWDLLDTKKDVQKRMPSDRYNADAFYHPDGANKSTVSPINTSASNICVGHVTYKEERAMLD